MFILSLYFTYFIEVPSSMSNYYKYLCVQCRMFEIIYLDFHHQCPVSITLLELPSSMSNVHHFTWTSIVIWNVRYYFFELFWFPNNDLKQYGSIFTWTSTFNVDCSSLFTRLPSSMSNIHQYLNFHPYFSHYLLYILYFLLNYI